MVGFRTDWYYYQSICLWYYAVRLLHGKLPLKYLDLFFGSSQIPNIIVIIALEEMKR